MKIDIKKYLNVFQYLQDCYQQRKTASVSFSYDVWAKELEASDKSYIRLMVIGKRPINSKMGEAFAKNFNLAGDEKEYFLNLIQYTQSKTQEHKNIFGKKLVMLLKSELDQIQVQQHYDFLSNPILPRLQVMLGFNDIDKSPKNLAWILGASEQNIEDGMVKLKELNLIDQNLDPVKRSFKVPDQFGDLGLEAFYNKNLEDSKSAFAMPKETRRFTSLFLPMNKKEFERYLENMNSFVNEQMVQFNSDDYSDRRLYQVHLNIIPVSEASTKEVDL